MGQENERKASVRVVACPNCGARECMEYRPGAFQCQFCKSKYRSSQPQQNRSSSSTGCFCGKRAVGRCTSCQNAVCKVHYLEWGDLLWSWEALKVNYSDSNGKASDVAAKLGGLAAVDLVHRSGWLYRDAAGVMQRIQEYRKHRQKYGPTNSSASWFGGEEFVESLLKIWAISSDQLDNVLCPPCLESHFAASVNQVETLVRDWARKGAFCLRCFERSRRSVRKALEYQIQGGSDRSDWDFIEFLYWQPFPSTRSRVEGF